MKSPVTIPKKNSSGLYVTMAFISQANTRHFVSVKSDSISVPKRFKKLIEASNRKQKLNFMIYKILFHIK